MTDLKELIYSFRTMVIFTALAEDKVISGFVGAIAAAQAGDSDSAVKLYCGAVSELYRSGDNFTEYLLRRVLEDENMYILRRAETGHTGTLMDECLASELYALEQLGRLPCYELLDSFDYDGFLPRYYTSELDFSAAYADRIHNLSKHGFGVYSSHHVFVVENG